MGRKRKDLINDGWKVLAIKSSAQIPNKQEITHKFHLLSPDTPYQEIILADWGKGSTNEQVHKERI